MANFNSKDTIEEVLEKMNKNGGNTEMIHAGSAFLQYKLQEKLLETQAKAHEEQLDGQRTNNKKLLETQEKQYKEQTLQQRKQQRRQTILNVILALAAVVSAIFSGLFYQNVIDTSKVLNRPYVFIEETTIEEYIENDNKMYRLIFRTGNAGNLAALQTNMEVFLGNEEITSSNIFSDGHVVSANSDNEIWIILKEESIKSLIRGSENSKQLSVEFKYQDAFERELCIKSLHSVVKVDDIYKLASDSSFECN